jgi:dienelactone hydrolase
MNSEICVTKKLRNVVSNPVMLLRCTLYAIAFIAVLGCTSSGVGVKEDQDGPAQTVYVPPGGRGPAVILLSGVDGPGRYQYYADNLAKLGYYSVLLDGNDIATGKPDGVENLKKAIARAQRAPHGLTGKVAVIGFSKGGYGALAIAASMPDVVSVVVAYYPAVTKRVKDMKEFTARIRVPILVLAGVHDNYFGCCMIESMRVMDSAARAQGIVFELVEYPHAEHGFNLAIPAYRSEDTADSWRRTVDILRKYHPLR